jgi:biopolymer transport protein ExbD
MQFYTKKRSRPVVPIVSLIDILAILLIFFIVTTTFKERKAHLTIDLPETRRLQVEVTTENRATLAVTAEGEFFLDDLAVEARRLEETLSEFRAASPGSKLELKADERADLRSLVAVWDALKGAGFEIKDVPSRIVVRGAGDK